MSESIAQLLKQLQQDAVEFVSLVITDLFGKDHYMTLPMAVVDEALFTEGKAFDGSSICGWAAINASDLLMIPDITTAYVNPFFQHKTMMFRCDVFEPTTMLPYSRSPRQIARQAEIYLKSTGIADTCYLGSEPEFFLFNDVRWSVDSASVTSHIDSREASWNSSRIYPEGNRGHRPAVKGGYAPLPPVDSAHEVRTAMCKTLADIGQVVEVHHHEVATGCQNEIGVRFDTLGRKADQTLDMKYVIKNVADSYGMTATFMPKPLVGDNGSGMHCHISLAKEGNNLFSGDKYGGLSEYALCFIGGILKHARALNAFTNPTTNSYKRLVPGFEAPVALAYSARNRSASIRIPASGARGRRIEVRFPDPAANPQLAFPALLMAGIDGIQNRIMPGEAMDKDLYDLPPSEIKNLPTVASSLSEALDALQADQQFLLAGNVFSEDLLNRYVQYKRKEVERLMCTTHPVEFDMYYQS